MGGPQGIPGRNRKDDMGFAAHAGQKNHRQPAQGGFGAGHAEKLRPETRYSAVVEQLAVLVAPASVGDDALFHLEHVARRDFVKEARRVRALDHIFHQRRDVDQSSAIADGPVFVVE